MSNFGNGLTVLLTAFVLAACGPESDRYGDAVREGTEQEAREETEQETSREGRETYTPEVPSDDFTLAADQELDRLQEEFAELKAGLESPQPELAKEIEQWEAEHQQLEQKLEKAPAVSDSEWGQFQSEVNVALQQLRRSLDDMSSRVRASLD